MLDRHYWLVKSEPDSFSFDDLLAAPVQTTLWNGVRNYQARNYMRDVGAVQVRAVERFSAIVPLAALRTDLE